jgi:long-chain acyl-CoA synthetase
MLNENVGILERDGDDASLTTSTLARLPLKAAEIYRKPDAFKFKKNGQWMPLSHDEFLLHVEELFFALRAFGVRPGDRVAIMSENRVEWAIADFAALSAGAVTVPVYPTLSAAQVHVLLDDSRPSVVFVSTADLLRKLDIGNPAFSARYVVVMDPEIHEPGVLRLEALYETGRQASCDYPGEFRQSVMAVDAEDVATIIYTSGTTGIPKGAMLTHRNLMSNIAATRAVLPLFPHDCSLSFLPLAHIFQRHVDYASIEAGVTIAYAENLTAVQDDMLEVRPTFAAGVPRFFEKIYGRIFSEVSRGPAIRRAIFEKALRIAKESLQTGQHTLTWKAADRVVFQTIRDRLGGRIRFFISGGAALQKDICEFFTAIGIPVFEGYGLTETSPVIALNGPGATRIGSVGKGVRSVEMRIAPDGEILVRGESVMKGYFKREKDTAEALQGGWFHTGDIGEIDADGFLKITDRKKDLIVTSGGKNVAPQPIESRLKSIPYFENVAIVGNGRKFVSALVVPNYDALAGLARAHRINFENPVELAHDREIYDLVMAEIDRRTTDLADFEKIRKIMFLDSQFTIESGELTPTMKIRRMEIEKKYKNEINGLYAI